MLSSKTRNRGGDSGPHPGERKISWLLRALILIPAALLLSCSTPSSENRSMGGAARTERGEKVQMETPSPGDTKLINGVEYIYTINPKYGVNPDEPQYVWVPKGQR